MVDLHELARLQVYGKGNDRYGILLRGYASSPRAGLFNTSRLRRLIAVLSELADEADRLNAEDTEATGVPW